MGEAKKEFLTDRDHEGEKKNHQERHELQKHRSSSDHLEGG